MPPRPSWYARVLLQSTLVKKSPWSKRFSRLCGSAVWPLSYMKPFFTSQVL